MRWLLAAGEAELDALAVGAPRSLSGDDWFAIAKRAQNDGSGSGVQCDNVQMTRAQEARYWKEASALGCSDAKVCLAQLSLEHADASAEQDLGTASQSLRQAAAANNDKAALSLARLYLDPACPLFDEAQALRMLRIACMYILKS